MQAKRHFRFPAYSMPTELLNQTTNQVPVMVLNAFVGASSLGNYNLTQRILGMPSALVANAFTEVFRQRASADFAEQGNCVAIFRKTFKSLLLLSLPPFALLFAFAPPAFAFVFGERWREAGEYTRALSVMYWFGFFASPLSYVYFIAGKQGENLIMHFYMIASTVASIFVGFKLFGTSLGVIWCFSLNYAAIYAFCCLRSYTFAKGEPMSKARPPQGAELA